MRFCVGKKCRNSTGRIRNRYDSLANWTKDNVELLQGELALVKVETQQLDEETGDLVTVPAFLVKVGENYTEAEADAEGNNTLKDTPKPFDKLPWMSALAADVYDWAKVEDPSVVTIKYLADNTWVYSTLADVLKTIKEVLPKKIEDVESSIANVNTAISGGVHFIGITTTELEDGSTKSSIKIGDKDNNTRTKGDVVLYGEKEFIWTGDSWYELGDLTRVGAVEESLSLLPENDRTTNKYVTHITNENGKLVAKKARPLATEVQYDVGNTSETVYSKIEEAFAAIATKENAHDHPYSPDTHGHGNILNQGTMTVTPLATTTDVGGVLVTDVNNKITRMTPATVRSLIGAGTSSLELGTTETTAAKGNHTHESYEADISAINSNYIRVNTDNELVHYISGLETEIVLDCGGAEI